jgi:hypothetical protein
MYLGQVRIDGRSYSAAPAQVSTVVTPPAPAALNLGLGLLGRRVAEQSIY